MAGHQIEGRAPSHGNQARNALQATTSPIKGRATTVPQTRRPTPAHERHSHAYGVPVRHPARIQPAPDTPITRPRRAAAGLVVAGLILTGCGSTPTPTGTAATRNRSPTDGAHIRPGHRPDPDPSPSARDERADRAGPAALAGRRRDRGGRAERSVDAGSEPWLLDPAEVAVSYATAAYGWTQAEAQPRPDGHTVDVAEGGRKLTLSLTQPGRAGAGGIWVVTGETRD